MLKKNNEIKEDMNQITQNIGKNNEIKEEMNPITQNNENNNKIKEEMNQIENKEEIIEKEKENNNEIKNNEDYINNNDKENEKEYEKNISYTNKNDIEYRDIGINTDLLPPEEIQKLVDNNQDLIELNEEEIQYKELHESKLKMQKELIKELSEKNQIYDLLRKSNNELKSKIDISNKKYNEIVKKIEEKKSDNIEQKLTLQIKEMQKEISANNTETERYKKMIDQLKNKLDFKTNLEKSSNFSRILKEETIRNDELKKELNSLTRLNRVQKQYINNYDKDYQISNKIKILKNEIQQTKNTIKDYQTKYIKLDKFIKLIHEKIVGIEMIIKKDKLNKDEPKNKKLFTREELKETIDLLNTLKNQVTEKRNQLNTMTKQNDLKVKKIIAKNKQILADFKEKEKMNKMLIFKKNELKRNIKNMSVNGIGGNQSNLVKHKYKLNVNNTKNQYINNNNELNNIKINDNDNNN